MTRNPTILIVDDDDTSRLTVRRMLERSQLANEFKLLEATSGEECLAICAVELPEIILLDYVLQDMGGLDVVLALSTDVPVLHVGIVMMTSNGDETNSVAAMEIGAIDYLPKGKLDSFVLVNSIRACLRSVKQNRAMESSHESPQREEEYHRIIGENAPLAIWISGPNGGVKFVNRFGLELTGCPIDHLLGDGWNQRVHPSDRERRTRALISASQGQKIQKITYRIRDRDGKSAWVIESVCPIGENQDQMDGLTGFCFRLDQLVDNPEVVRQISSKFEVTT